MGDRDGKSLGGFARHPAGPILLVWIVLDQITSRGRSLAPNVMTAAWFQRLAALILGLVLAIGFLVAFRRALRTTGRACLGNAGLALLFAVACAVPVAGNIYVEHGIVEFAAAGRTNVPDEEAKIEHVLDRAFTSEYAKGRLAGARGLYVLKGYRIVYKDEAGVPRLYDPPPDLVASNETRRRAEDTLQRVLAVNRELASRAFWATYAYLLGIGVMLIGSLVLVVRARPQPEPPQIDP